MNKQLRIFYVLFLWVGCGLLFGQEIEKFTYGGSKGKFKGTFKVDYFLEVDSRLQSLNDLDNTVDLNNYKVPPRVVVEIS